MMGLTKPHRKGDRSPLGPTGAADRVAAIDKEIAFYRNCDPGSHSPRCGIAIGILKDQREALCGTRDSKAEQRRAARSADHGEPR